MIYDRTMMTLAAFLNAFDPFQCEFYRVPMSCACFPIDSLEEAI